MPKAAVKMQNAPSRTRWILTQHETDTPNREADEAAESTMQARNQYFDLHDPPLPRYESPNRSRYGVPSLDRKTSSARKGGSAANGHQHDYDYNTPLEERASHQIGLSTHTRAQSHDVVGDHLLYETARMDAHDYEVLDMAEVDALKKEHARLSSRIEATNRKVALESKVKDAAQNLHRLYSVSKRPATPQNPDSPLRRKASLLVGRSPSGNGAPSIQADEELAASKQKVEELNQVIKILLDRRQLVETKLLKHTAAVLSAQASRSQERKPGNCPANVEYDAEQHDEDDALSAYSPDDFDGIRDILRGAPLGSSMSQKSGNVHKMQQEHEQQMTNVQSRLEQLNSQLRHVISEASRTRGIPVEAEPHFDDEYDDTRGRLDQRFARLEDNLQILEREQHGTKRMQDSVDTTRNAVEEQLAEVNQRVHHTLLLGADMSNLESLRQPPQATGHGYQQQLRYLEGSLNTMEELLRQHGTKAVEDAQAEASVHRRKADEYEATLGSLWEIMQLGIASHQASIHDREVDDEDRPPSPGPLLREDFSLQALSARVQHLSDRAQSAKEQQDTLRRQVQQQRELNGKSDAEKDRQLVELQTRHEELSAEHSAVQEKLSRSVAQHAQAEDDASQSRSELLNIMNEFDSLKRTTDARQKERDETKLQVQTHQERAASLQDQNDALEAQVSDLTDDARLSTLEAEGKAKEADSKLKGLTDQLATAVTAQEEAEQRHADLQKEMQGLESEIVRLTTELTMAKAELEGAYGSRAERAREAQAAEVAGLTERNQQMTQELLTLRNDYDSALAQMKGARSQPATDSSTDRAKELERELDDMAADFNELAKESVRLEKERGQLEDLIDGLRDRSDMLETQLNDEKVRWLGVKSPQADGTGAQETTSTMVLRQEFKKMMRETRAEGVKALRVSFAPY